MLQTVKNFAETTDVIVMNDVLDDALRSLYIKGSLLLREAYAPPWAIAIPSADQLALLLDIKKGTRVVAFHLVEFGHCEVQADGFGLTLSAGELVVCFGGVAHRLFQGNTTQTQSIETLLAGSANAQRPASTGNALGASLLCGVFMLHHTAFNPLYAALPPIMRVSLSRPGELHNLSGVAHLMAREIGRTSCGRGYIVERFLEVLCAEAIRSHIEAAPRQEIGWFRGIKDPVIGGAMKAIHLRPAENWSVQRLAHEVSMSPSRFAARFTETLGDSPMAYLAKWRMNVACRKLTSSTAAIEQIASDVGYESAAAFNRAFKKHVGLPPAMWRLREAS